MPALLNPFLNPTGKTLLEMITDAGLLTSLALCLDAGDANSYGGSSQTWLDVSGGAQNFFRGATSSSEASDPAFNGVAGGKSANEYFSLDGADFFKEASALTFAESWHKNNAAFTFGFVMYADNSDNPNSDAVPIFNCYFDGSRNSGSAVYVGSTTNNLLFNASKGSTDALNQVVMTQFLPASRNWLCAIISQNEATGAMLAKLSSAAPTSISGTTYSSPSSVTPGAAYSLMAFSDNGSPYRWASGVRLAMVFAWNRVLTSGELDTIYTSIKERFTTLA